MIGPREGRSRTGGNKYDTGSPRPATQPKSYSGKPVVTLPVVLSLRDYFAAACALLLALILGGDG